MHAEVDGQASDRELAALNEYLAANPEAQNVRTDLRKLTDILNQVEELEPPDDLHGSIMAALAPQPPRAVVGIRTRTSTTRFRMPLIRYGYALAAGLLLGALLTGIAFRSLPQQEKSYVSGTMTAVENTPHYVVVERIQLADPDLTGSVELSQNGNSEMVIFDLNGEKTVKVGVRFDPTLGGIKSFSQEPNNISSVEGREGSISFESQGKERSILVLAGQKRALPLVNLDFYVEDKLVHQGRLGGTRPADASLK